MDFAVPRSVEARWRVSIPESHCSAVLTFSSVTGAAVVVVVVVVVVAQPLPIPCAWASEALLTIFPDVATQVPF